MTKTKRNLFKSLLLMAMHLALLTSLSAAKLVDVEVNKAKRIDFPGNISNIFVANPTIADVQTNKPLGIYIYGKSTGTTSVFVTTTDGKNTEITLEVTQVLEHLNATLKKAFPGETIQTVSSPNGIVLLGSVSSSKVLKDAESIAAQFIKKGSVVNKLSLSTSTQVYLKVKIAEVNRSVLSKIDTNLGLAFTNTEKYFSLGGMTGRAPVVDSGFARSNALINAPSGSAGFRFQDGISDYSVLLDMLDQENLATILAEPNLVALSGEPASFLVGGEVPFPVPQGSQSVTIEFKSFGIGLNFTPTVLGPNLINLRVNPEVSELDYTNATSFDVGGIPIRIPALKTRKAETSVELASGQSFAIAGLLSHNIANTIKDFPGLANIPILGALFRSTDFKRNATELVIIVTPYIVNPADPKKLEVPTTGLDHSSTMEMLFSKRLNRKNTARLKTVAGFQTQ